MPIDQNFIVITVVLAGLLVWSMTKKTEELVMMEQDDDSSEEEYLKDVPYDKGMVDILQWMQRMCQSLVNRRQEMDAIFLGNKFQAKTLNDLLQEAPRWAGQFDLLYRDAIAANDTFQVMVQKLNQDFGEDGKKWVRDNQKVIQIPVETRDQLNSYKHGGSYTQYNQMNVQQRYDEHMPYSDDYNDMNPNQQFNKYGDSFMVAKAAQKPGVFQQVDQGDDVTMDVASGIYHNTPTNAPAKGQASNQTQTNDDVYNTLNPDGKLGSGALNGVAMDTDVRQVNDAQNRAAGSVPSGGSYVVAVSQGGTAPDPKIPKGSFQQVQNDQISKLQSDVTVLQMGAAAAAQEKANKAAQDGAQNVPPTESGKIPVSIPVGEQATILPPVDETDAAPSKPPPQIPPTEVVPSTSKVAPIPGFEEIGQKRVRDRISDPFVALQSDKKKKPKPEPKEETKEQAPEEELDLTGAGGTKRGGDDPILTPESRGDIKTSDKNKPKKPQYETEVAEVPLVGKE